MSEERGNDAAGYLGWFFLGAIAGAAAAVLLTPKTGRETRELLAERDSSLRAAVVFGAAGYSWGCAQAVRPEILPERGARIPCRFAGVEALPRDVLAPCPVNRLLHDRPRARDDVMTMTTTDNLAIARKYLEAVEGGAEGGALADFFTSASSDSIHSCVSWGSISGSWCLNSS